MAGKPKQPPVQVGDLLAGKYRVERQLGTGGMGVVVAAVDVELGELRAIKVLLPDRSAQEEMEERFLREARAVIRLRSPHVARVYDLGRLPTGEPYIVMEHLVGQDLRDLLVGRGCALAVQDAADFVMQALEGLAEAHAAGIVHRDLKPANLFLTEDDHGLPCIKVLDFGISKVSADLELGREMTQTAAMLGTPLYMAPEQMRSAKDVDRRSDIWSLGVILYKLLTGRTPFLGDTVATVCLDVAERDPLPPSTFNPNVPPELEAVVMGCLEKDRDRRYQHALELGTALAAHAGPQAQASLSRINRWHHAPPPATTSQPSFPGLAERPSGSGLGEAPPAAVSEPGQAVAVLGGPSTEAARGQAGSSPVATRRSRRVWAVFAAGVGVAAVVAAVLLARGDEPARTRAGAGGASGAAVASSADGATSAEAGEGGEAFAGAADSGRGGGDARSNGGAPPTPKPSRPRPRSTNVKSAQPPVATAEPAASGSDPFGKGRW
ncbi:MAG: protein kinase [Deltaproteobacteria bacterium]|nr:protein kinase [Deltaproteobacteria bacterium]